MTQRDPDIERRDFEDWHCRTFGWRPRSFHGNYQGRIQDRWDGFQARAAIEDQPRPSASTTHTGEEHDQPR